MKRTLLMLLNFTLLLPLLVSCNTSQLSSGKTETLETKTSQTSLPVTEKEAEKEIETETETETEPQGMIPQSAQEQAVTRILVIGNSGSNDIFYQLGRVFNAQGFGGKRYTLGFLYYSGCTFSQHVGFIKQNSAVYDYRKTNSTSYVTREETTMEYALRDEQWDIVFLTPGGSADLRHEDLNLKLRREIEAYVDKLVPTEHKFGYLGRSVSPNDPQFFSPDWYRQPPKDFHKNLVAAYGTDDYFTRYKMVTETTKKNIVSDPTYAYTINTGSGIAFAYHNMGLTQIALYRDYTHLTDLGRVIASYCFYAQLTGEPIEEVKLDRIPAKSRFTHYQSEGDLVLTDYLKDIIKESANFSLKNPWISQL